MCAWLKVYIDVCWSWMQGILYIDVFVRCYGVHWCLFTIPHTLALGYIHVCKIYIDVLFLVRCTLMCAWLKAATVVCQRLQLCASDQQMQPTIVKRLIWDVLSGLSWSCDFVQSAACVLCVNQTPRCAFMCDSCSACMSVVVMYMFCSQ